MCSNTGHKMTVINKSGTQSKKIKSLRYFHCHTARKWMEFLWRDFPIIIDTQSVSSTWLLLTIDNEISADSQHYSKGGMTLQRCFFRKNWLVHERRLTHMNRRLIVVSPTSILFAHVFCCWVNSLNVFTWSVAERSSAYSCISPFFVSGLRQKGGHMRSVRFIS